MEDKRREMMGEQEETRRPIERLGLIIYTLYSIGVMSSCAKVKAPIGVNYALLGMVLVCWILFLVKYGSFHSRTMVELLCMHGMLLLHILYAQDLKGALPYYGSVIVLVGLYSYLDEVLVSSVCIGVVFFIYFVILQRVDFSDSGSAVSAIMQMSNMFVIEYLIYIWVCKRNENTERMQSTISDLREAEASRDDFLANISHEIRTPINTICGISEILLQKEMSSDIRMQLYYIQTAGRNLTSVVSDILDFSELQSGNIEIVEEEYNISSTINDAIDMCMGKINEKKTMELIVNCDAMIPSVLKGDEKKIRRVILNLLDNAIKFTEEGCVCLDVSYRREEYGINLMFTIQDTGIGMELADLEKLFTGFTQVDTRRNRKNGGIGLGLAISNIMVKKMGGVITIKSKPGQGTTVKVIIPQTVIKDTPIVQLEDKSKINVGVYINLEEYIYPQIRDAYTKIVNRVIEQMQVRNHVCMNLAEVKKWQNQEEFTHIIITLLEYEEAKEYFDELSKTVNVIVVLFREQEEKLDNPHLLKLYKPFYVLPLVSVVKGSMRGKTKGSIGRAKGFTTKDTKILVVDDNIMNLKVMEGILGKYKISVVTANSGKAALQVIEEKNFDLVLMDHMMPEMDGIETLHRIRNMAGNYYRNVPIIALTANTIAGAREMFLEEGFDDFVEKPVECSVLERVLQRNLPAEKIVYNKEEDNLEEESAEQKEGTQATEEMKEEPVKEEKDSLKQGETVQDEVSLEESKNLHEEQPSEAMDTIGDLDKKTGITFCGGEENWLSILKVCGDTAEENKTKLEEFYQTKNWKEYTILIHGVKSSMKTIGAMNLSEMAKALEQAGKEGNSTYIEEHHQEMLTEYNRVDAFLHASPLLYQRTENAKAEKKEYERIDEALFDEKISQLEEAMYNFDGDGMIVILKSLQDCEYGGVPLDKTITSILRKVEMTDYMSAYDALVKVKNEITGKSKKTQKEG